MKFKPGELVFETYDGGAMPLRVVAQARHLGDVLTKLDPPPGHDLRGWALRRPRYIRFMPQSLSRYT